jgi:hypothetical protein
MAMESIFLKTLFFVVLKMRPAEALFGAFKKSVFAKILRVHTLFVYSYYQKKT